jgi:hypothetical protein
MNAGTGRKKAQDKDDADREGDILTAAARR